MQGNTISSIVLNESGKNWIERRNHHKTTTKATKPPTPKAGVAKQRIAKAWSCQSSGLLFFIWAFFLYVMMLAAVRTYSKLIENVYFFSFGLLIM